MPKINVVRSKKIQENAEKIFNILTDMSQWAAWSPWLIMEPETKVSVSDDRTSYGWEGQLTGAGHMSIASQIPHQRIEYDLTFLKPFKSTAKVAFALSETGNMTRVSWEMDSQLPFFLFFMKKSMESFIGMDYERGLNLLKDYVEDGKVHSLLNFLGTSNYEGGHFVGIKHSSTIKEMPENMAKDFEELMGWANENGLDTRNSFSIYHDFNVKGGTCAYSAAISCDQNSAQNLPAHLYAGHQKPAKIYTLEHVGPYRHLGNGWATLYTLIRSKEIKPIKGYHPFETYQNNPNTTAPENLITHISFAVN